MILAASHLQLLSGNDEGWMMYDLRMSDLGDVWIFEVWGIVFIEQKVDNDKPQTSNDKRLPLNVFKTGTKFVIPCKISNKWRNSAIAFYLLHFW